MTHPEDLLLPYASGDLQPAEAAAVRTHLATCADCSNAVAELSEMDARLRALPPLPPGRLPALPPPRRRRLLRAALLAAAAIALFASGSALTWWWTRPAPAVQGGLYAFVFYEPVALRAAASDQDRRTRYRRFSDWQRPLKVVTGLKLLDESGRTYEAGRTIQALDRRAADGLALSGFILVRADSYQAAEAFVAGCPVLDDGGRVEIRRVR